MRLWKGPVLLMSRGARKIAVILHCMRVDGTTYGWAAAEPIAAGMIKEKQETRVG